MDELTFNFGGKLLLMAPSHYDTDNQLRPKLDGDADYEPNDDDNFSDTFSDLGVDDDDEADADFGEPASKKRKRAVTTSKPRTMDSITNARIKNEGGEAFILDDDDSTSLAHKQTSRAPGTFERRK
jgi:hypothetical protein